MRCLFAAAAALVTVSILTSCAQKRPITKPAGPPHPWRLVSYDPSGGYGTYLGNGCIGVRLHAEGVGWHNGAPLQCLMAGLYKGESILSLPNFSDFPIYYGREAKEESRFTLDPDEHYEQTLDMKAGILRTRCTFQSDRRAIKTDVSFILSRELDRVDILMKVVPAFTGPITVRVGFEQPAPGLSVLKTAEYGSFGRRIMCQVSGQTEKVALGADFRSNVASITSKPTLRGLAKDLTFEVEDDKQLMLRKIVVIARNTDVPLLNHSLHDRTTRSEVRKSWEKLWQSRIEIEGDPEAQQAINSCTFYLLQSVCNGTDCSIPPMGLSNDAWHGHIFWDADTWMFPALLPQYPELARSIVAYRFKTLYGAMQNAKSRGLKGAEYAWESARTGIETIEWPFKEERHITSDVALAQWDYYRATQDRKWLVEAGYPVISACAEYWVTRVKYNPGKDRYEILGVVGPDEDAEIVDNNAYTNASAKRTLELAAKAGGLIGKRVPKEWEHVARKMYIPFDARNNRFVECDQFRWPHTKQADTELLIYPLEHPMSERVRSNTFDYWVKKVNPNGPAMSSSVHAVIAARLGRTEEAYRYFVDSYKLFFRPPFNYFNEKRSPTFENMCFLTGAAGPIQAVIYGFCGLRYDDRGKITLDPHLPSKWKSVTLRSVHAAGKRFDIIIRRGEKPRITPLPL